MNERYSRQKDIVPAERLSQCRATVIGIGAIGRQVALQLTAIGISNLQIIDFDIIEESNIASQGYMQKDLGRPKVDATSELCRQINYDLNVGIVFDRFRRSMQVGNCMFNCVDSINTRKLIWESVKDCVSFYCDARMSAETFRILNVTDEKSRQHYPVTLFSSDEAYAGPCTAKTTIYCANIAAGFMLAQFTKYLRCIPIDNDVQVNLLACEMNVGVS